MQAKTVILIAMGLYLVMMVVIGFLYSKKNKDVGDFYLGGRRLGPIVTAMSAEASDMSSWLLMGLPGVAYLSGVANAFWTAIGLAIGTYLNWLLVSKRIRRYSNAIDAITVPEFFSKRFGDERKIITGIAAVIIIVFFVPYTASGFAACGKLFHSLFNVDYMAAMLVSAAVIVGYCILGGFLAASTTDLIQSIVMSVALIVVTFFGISEAGGLDAVISNAKELSGYLSFTKSFDVATNSSTPYGFLTIVSTLAWGLGYFGMPHILLRFMAVENPKKLTLSRRIATVWVFISLGIAICIGIIGNAMSKAGAIDNLTGSGSENVIIKIADHLSHFGVLPTICAGLILAGILAATMSTADSQLLAASSGVSQNLLRETFGIKISDKMSMIIARVVVVVIAIVSVIIARDPNSSVFSIVSFAWAGFGAAFGPGIICALFWKRANWQGVLSGMIAGGAMVFIWKYGIAKLGGAFAIYELLPAFIVGFVVIVIVSLCTKEPAQSILDKFDEVKSISE